MPSRLPVASIASYTEAMISLIVYSDTSYSTAVVGLLRDEGQAERALPRVVRHRVRHEPHVEVLGDLLHDGRLADAGRAQ